METPVVDPRLAGPLLLMVALSFAVWFRMYFERIGEIVQRRIRVQSLATRAQAREQLTRTNAADNFSNLLELPVLFYAGVLSAWSFGLVSDLLVGLAWGFAGLRVLHSLIHVTYNRVRHRFYAYVAGGFVLLAFWIALALQLVAKGPA